MEDEPYPQQGPTHICNICAWEFDPALGDPEHGVPPGTVFADVPADRWSCPVCGAHKHRFSPLTAPSAPSGRAPRV